jgi:ribosomal protein L11 methyltransferase
MKIPMAVITHLWSRISSVKWEDAWVERLRFAGEQNLVIKKFPASRSIRLDLYTDASTARKLKSAFGGSIRPFDAAGWTPPASKITDPLRIAGELRIYRDKTFFSIERSAGKGKPLLIPSGMAFGTGDHATTARCLQLLVEATSSLRDRGGSWSLLDLGCGSGILALAAELLGATKLLGVDFDEACVRISKENAALNKLPRSKFQKADVLRWKPPAQKGEAAAYDIVAANLYSTILTAASPMIVHAIKSGGILILSGILAVEEKAVLKTFSALGLKHRKTLKRGKWAAVLLTK